jgi:hypothetical protein
VARRRPASGTRSRSRLTRRPAKKAAPQPTVSAAFPYPTLLDFLENGHGNLHLGHLPWSGFGALISDDDITYAALSRREEESIPDLLNRLELALITAFQDDQLIDEFAE